MTTRLGVIGAGNIFERGYLPALRATTLLRVVAVADIDRGRADAGAAHFPGADAHEDADALLARDDLDAVLVATPTHTHAELAIAALRSGRDVLSEKPMARTLADARRMADTAAETGRRLMVGQTRRFDERWLAAREQVAAGRVGTPVYLFRSEHASNGSPAGAWPWLAEQSGGVLWDVGVHGADLFRWFLGSTPRTAFARLLRSRPEAVAGGAPDAAVVTFDFGAGCHALLSVSWLHPPAWGPFYASLGVVGTGGRIDTDDRDAHPALVATEGGLAIPRFSPLLSATATAFQREIEAFARALADGTPFPLSVDDAVAAVAMLDAAERSAASGRPEEVLA